jgi:hypothetical protein
MGGIQKAQQELGLADHMLYVTFPLLNDKRIFLNAINHLGMAIREVVRSFMNREADYKRIRMPPEDFLINDFINKYSQKLGLNSYIKMIRDVTSFNNIRDRASIKLKRKDKFIVISPEYSMFALTINDAKNYLGLAREFMDKMKRFVK